MKSAEGAKCNSLGQRPRNGGIRIKALKARNVGRYFALSALEIQFTTYPGALPQAFAFRAVGAVSTVDLKSRSCNRECRTKNGAASSNNLQRRTIQHAITGRQRCTPLCLFYLLRSLGSFLFLRFHLFSQLGFLLGSEVADDHFAFRKDLNLKIN